MEHHPLFVRTRLCSFKDRDQTHTLGLHLVKGSRMKPGFQKEDGRVKKRKGSREQEGVVETT